MQHTLLVPVVPQPGFILGGLQAELFGRLHGYQDIRPGLVGAEIPDGPMTEHMVAEKHT